MVRLGVCWEHRLASSRMAESYSRPVFLPYRWPSGTLQLSWHNENILDDYFLAGRASSRAGL